MTTTNDKSTRALIAGCRQGNKLDWAELIGRLSPVIFSVCYRFRLSREESYDVFGKVSLVLLENLDKLREAERIFGYVATVAGHEAMAMRARTRLHKIKLKELKSDLVDPFGDAYKRPPMERDEDLAIMSRAFEGLSNKCRELLRMLFLESAGITYRDISHRLGIPVSSIGPTRGRCLEKLKQNMIKEGYEE
jgi:RNA polymerase sigma factor (sigma-70 family)